MFLLFLVLANVLGCRTVLALASEYFMTYSQYKMIRPESNVPEPPLAWELGYLGFRRSNFNSLICIRPSDERLLRPS